jgi:DoxX-like family
MIIVAILALAVSAFVAFGFFKAGKFKAFSPREALLAAGFGWVEKLPFGVVRLIAWLELLGAVGIVAAPVAAYFIPGFAWAQVLGVLAADGLALTMLVASIMHIARGEFKYTWKSNLGLLVASLVAIALQTSVTLPLF